MPSTAPVNHLDAMLGSLPEQGLHCYALLDGTAMSREVVEKHLKAALPTSLCISTLTMSLLSPSALC